MMLRVYLDENKWIDLARAASGHPQGEKFKTVAMMIAAAISCGEASFPLSAGHMFETWKQKSGRRRHEVATTMLAISRNHAIAPHWELVPGEIDRALRRRFGRPIDCRPVRPFGQGIKHRSGIYAPSISETLRARVLAAEPTLSQSELSDAIDLVLLAGPLEDLPLAGVAAPPVKPAQDFARAQNEQVQRFIDYAADKDTRRRGVAARQLIDIQEILEVGLARANVSWHALMELGADEVTAFMLDLPSRAAGLELMWRQFDNQQTKWKPNDLVDIGYLSCAVAYCDIVVTERKWTHMLNQGDAPKRLGTTVISDLNDLIELLVNASAVAA
jgi:hypothetical protein